MPSKRPGPLPAHVYRRRRLVVITVAVLLVLGLGRMLSWSSDGSGGGEDKATQAGANTSPSAAETTKKGAGPKDGQQNDQKDCKGKSKFRGGDKAKGKRKACQGSAPTSTPTPTPTPTPPATPSGPCPDADVHITPSLPDPVAGRDVAIVLNFQTGTTEACTWRVSAETMELKITAGPDLVWWSGECPAAIPAQDIIIRREVPTPVAMAWSSKRSDEYCTDRTAWSLPGPYVASASALEGEPTDVAFELLTPVAAVVTQTAAPTQQPTDKPDKGKNNPSQTD